MPYSHSYVNEEVMYSDGEQLISTTDTSGRITSANKAFCAVAGYTEEELIGKPHNVIRHKDMPKAAFEDLWSKLRKNQPWIGLVKNRTKCGRYYWVSAFVTPIYENGQVVGYQSVRTKPSREDVARAHALYSGKTSLKTKLSKLLFSQSTIACFPVIPFILGALAMHLVTEEPLFSIAFALAMLVLCAIYLVNINQITKLATLAQSIFNSPLIALSYSSLSPKLSQIETSIKFLEAKSITILGRISSTSNRISNNVDNLKRITDDVEAGTLSQQAQIEQIATAMEEMVTTVEDIAKNTLETSNFTEEASVLSDNCSDSITNTSNSLNILADKVEHSASSAEQLNEQAKNIEEVINVIRTITDQTGLLALNAAIEAARAGEQGRGFAVVADEVRALAQKTTQSTVEIESTIEAIQNSISRWVVDMQETRDDAKQRVSEMTSNSDLVHQQKQLMTEVLGQSIQVSSATEEQGVVAKEINRNIHEINSVALSNTESTVVLQKNILSLDEASQEMHSLVRSFDAC